jgi:hypothetical protein
VGEGEEEEEEEEEAGDRERNMVVALFLGTHLYTMYLLSLMSSNTPTPLQEPCQWLTPLLTAQQNLTISCL